MPVILAFLVFLAGCNRDEGKRTYTEVRRPAPAAAKSAHPPIGHQHQPSKPEVVWTTPEGWEETAASGMRLASFKVGEADGSIIILSGNAGGDVENIKRWAGQVDVTMNDEAILSFIEKQQRVECEGGFSALIVDLTSETGPVAKSALAAIAQVEDHTVFVKLSGLASLLNEELENFIALSKSLRLKESAAKPAAASSAPAESAGKIAWVAPEGWTETAGTGMRLATLTAPEEGDCSIIALAGEAGGAAANIERWLGQIKVSMSQDELLAFLDKQEMVTTKDGHSVMLIDMTGLVEGADAEAMLAGISRFGDKTIFIKMMGTGTYLKGQLAGFRALCASLHLDGGAP
jgi:hypothetical protein